MQQDNSQMFLYRLNVLEQKMKEMQLLMNGYVTAKELDLHLQAINEKLDRMEKVVSDPETGLQVQVAGLTNSINKLVIRMLYGIISIIASVAIIVVASYFTHLLGK